MAFLGFLSPSEAQVKVIEQVTFDIIKALLASESVIFTRFTCAVRRLFEAKEIVNFLVGEGDSIALSFTSFDDRCHRLLVCGMSFHQRLYDLLFFERDCTLAADMR